MMILSTLSTDAAASVASLIAHCFAASESRIWCSVDESVPSVSAYEQSAGLSYLAIAKLGTYLNVDAPHFASRTLMLRPQPADDLVPLGASERVLCKCARDNLECLRPPLHPVLREAPQSIPVHLHALRKLELRRTRPRDEARVLDQRLDDVHPIVDRALEVIKTILSRASKNDRRGASLFRAVRGVIVRIALNHLAQYGNAVAADLDALEDVDEAGFLRCGRTDTRKWRGIDDAAETAEVELREDLEDSDVEAIQVVQRELADARARDDDLDPGVCDLLEDLRRSEDNAICVELDAHLF